METHISEMSDLFQKLTDLGENQLTDNWKVAIILSSLPSSYFGMITALEARPDEQLTLPLIHSKLIGEHLKRKESGKLSESSKEYNASVLKMTSKKLKCFFCKRGSHIKKDCTKYKEWLQKQQQGNQPKQNKSSGEK